MKKIAKGRLESLIKIFFFRLEETVFIRLRNGENYVIHQYGGVYKKLDPPKVRKVI